MYMEVKALGKLVLERKTNPIPKKRKIKVSRASINKKKLSKTKCK